MKALLKFFQYNNKLITIIVAFIFLTTYILFGLIYDESLEIKLAIYFNFIINIICIKDFIRKIKINNFERFLSTSPIGRKSILKTLYLINILISFTIPILLYTLYKIRINFIPIIDNSIFIFNFKLPNIMFLVLIGVSLVIGAFFIIILLNNNNSNSHNILKLESLSILFILLFLIISYLFIYKFNIFTFNIRALIFTMLCFIFYIFLYFLNLKVYLKSDL